MSNHHVCKFFPIFTKCFLPASKVRDAVPLHVQEKAAEGAEPGDAGPGGQVGEGPLLHHAEVRGQGEAGRHPHRPNDYRKGGQDSLSLYCLLGSVADPGSGAFSTPGSGIRDPGWVKKGSGSGMNNPDHVSESLEINFLG